MKKTKENQIAEVEMNKLIPITVGLITASVIVAFGINIVNDVGSDFTVNSTEYNATVDATTGLAKITSKIPLIVTIIVAAVIITLLVRNLSFNN